jgi:uncharacterized protein with HEPN domain
MSRDPGLFVQDILDACRKITSLADGMDISSFSVDWRTHDAILHNLEIIGEAVKRLPPELVTDSTIPWRRIAGFRDVLAHAYFSVDDAIVWNVVEQEIPRLTAVVQRLLQGLDGARN